MSTQPTATSSRPGTPEPENATAGQLIAPPSARPGIEESRSLIPDGVLDSVAAVRTVDFVERPSAVEDLEPANSDSAQALAGRVDRGPAA